jgi:hypothetical protein
MLIWIKRIANGGRGKYQHGEFKVVAGVLKYLMVMQFNHWHLALIHSHQLDQDRITIANCGTIFMANGQL